MPFRNLFFQLAEIRDHNFCEFLDRLEKVDERFLQSKFRQGYTGLIEPYFDPIIPLTLHPTSCDAFFRLYPQWPITPRDYYLSKLFQFLYQPIEIRYAVDYRTEDDVRKQLEAILDRVPDGALAHLHQWDWWDFYGDMRSLALVEVYGSLVKRLEEFCSEIREGGHVGEDAVPEASVGRKRQRRHGTDERDSIITNCYRRWPTDRGHWCKILDQNGIPTTPNMREHQLLTWQAAWNSVHTRNTLRALTEGGRLSTRVRALTHPWARMHRDVPVVAADRPARVYSMRLWPGPDPVLAERSHKHRPVNPVGPVTRTHVLARLSHFGVFATGPLFSAGRPQTSGLQSQHAGREDFGLELSGLAELQLKQQLLLWSGLRVARHDQPAAIGGGKGDVEHLHRSERLQHGSGRQSWHQSVRFFKVANGQ